MIEITGKYASAKVFTDNIEPSASGQIQAMCDQEYMKGSKIRVMPDVHAGKGCTIGTTLTIDKYVVPNMVGVDIGCGMETVKLKEKRLNLPDLDSYIRKQIPSGRNIRERPHRSHGRIDLSKLHCANKVNIGRAIDSLGTLGGGNHFIEAGKDDDGAIYLVIHSGSRNIGLQVAEYYQKIAYESVGGRSQKEVPYEMAYLSGDMLENYLNDMAIMQQYAVLNRQIMKEEILSNMKIKDDGSFATIHNYIDLDAMILRKGAVSAQKGEQLLIPINMRDGSLLCTGLGNADWNYSAPHGAGRLMSRTQAENTFTLNAFKKEMEGIFTTSVNKGTLDECPMAYKPIEEIVAAITDTAKIEHRIRPIYNFKADESWGVNRRKAGKGRR